MPIFVLLKLKQHIPNAITCGNLLCGCLAIVQTFNGNLVWAAYLVGIAAVLDFFDGFFARLLKVSSPIGKDLDSLADMVTFGVVPGFVMFKMLQMRYMQETLLDLDRINNQGAILNIDNYIDPRAYVAFLIPIFSAIRLAKFNNDARQSDSFIGLPTPANAIFICSIGMLVSFYPIHFATSISPVCDGNYALMCLLNNSTFLVVVTLLLTTLLVAELPLIALKFKSFGWKGNEIRFVFLGLSLGLLLVFHFVGIPMVIILYILLSVVNNLIRK